MNCGDTFARLSGLNRSVEKPIVRTSPSKLRRTIRAKLVLDRDGKRHVVKREYYAWRRELKDGKQEQLYSATRQKRKTFGERDATTTGCEDP
jgi:hypothetical protein